MKIYRIAKKLKKPYKIFLITPGGSEQIGEIDAHSEMQARRFFLQQDSKDYAAYLELGYTIKAVLDEEEFKRREQIRKSDEESREEQIQNAWWNQ